MDGKSGKEAARILRMSTAAIYLAKRRVMVRLKQEIHKIVANSE